KCMVAVIARPFPKQSPRFHKGNLVAAVPRYVYSLLCQKCQNIFYSTLYGINNVMKITGIKKETKGAYEYAYCTHIQEWTPLRRCAIKEN
ncbi:MAG: hypothetical protein BROFUL_02878, partial [Candidatus Brocadia fulgida]